MASSSTPPFLHPDVLHAFCKHLLPHLPLVTLGRLSCTCKALHELISSAPARIWTTAAASRLHPAHPALRANSATKVRKALVEHHIVRETLRDGQYAHELLLTGAGSDQALQVSPDGRHLAVQCKGASFGSDQDVMVCEPGADYIRVRGKVQHAATAAAPLLRWSADGRQLWVLQTVREDESDWQWDDITLQIVDVRTGAVRDATSSLNVPPARYHDHGSDMNLEWSCNGGHMAFCQILPDELQAPDEGGMAFRIQSLLGGASPKPVLYDAKERDITWIWHPREDGLLLVLETRSHELGGLASVWVQDVPAQAKVGQPVTVSSLEWGSKVKAWDPNSQFAAFVDEDVSGSMQLVDLRSGAVCNEIGAEDTSPSAIFSGAGHVAVLNEDETGVRSLWVYSLPQCRRVFLGDRYMHGLDNMDIMIDAAWAPDGSLLALAREQHNETVVSLYDCSRWVEVVKVPLKPFTLFRHSLCWSLTGSFIVLAGRTDNRRRVDADVRFVSRINLGSVAHGMAPPVGSPPALPPDAASKDKKYQKKKSKGGRRR